MAFKYKPGQMVCLSSQGYDNRLYNVVGTITEQVPPNIFGEGPIYGVFFEHVGHYVIPENELQLIQ